MGFLMLMGIGPSGEPGGGDAPAAIITESSDFIVTESDDILVTEQNIA